MCANPLAAPLLRARPTFLSESELRNKIIPSYWLLFFTSFLLALYCLINKASHREKDLLFCLLEVTSCQVGGNFNAWYPKSQDVFTSFPMLNSISIFEHGAYDYKTAGTNHLWLWQDF